MEPAQSGYYDPHNHLSLDNARSTLGWRTSGIPRNARISMTNRFHPPRASGWARATLELYPPRASMPAAALNGALAHLYTATPFTEFDGA